MAVWAFLSVAVGLYKDHSMFFYVCLLWDFSMTVWAFLSVAVDLHKDYSMFIYVCLLWDFQSGTVGSCVWLA